MPWLTAIHPNRQWGRTQTSHTSLPTANRRRLIALVYLALTVPRRGVLFVVARRAGSIVAPLSHPTPLERGSKALLVRLVGVPAGRHHAI